MIQIKLALDIKIQKDHALKRGCLIAYADSDDTDQSVHLSNLICTLVAAYRIAESYRRY